MAAIPSRARHGLTRGRGKLPEAKRVTLQRTLSKALDAVSAAVDLDFLHGRHELAERRARTFFRNTGVEVPDVYKWFRLAENFLAIRDASVRQTFRRYLQQKALAVAEHLAKTDHEKARELVEALGPYCDEFGTIHRMSERVRAWLSSGDVSPRYVEPETTRSLSSMLRPAERYEEEGAAAMRDGRVFDALQWYILEGTPGARIKIRLIFGNASLETPLRETEREIVRRNYRLRFHEPLPEVPYSLSRKRPGRIQSPKNRYAAAIAKAYEKKHYVRAAALLLASARNPGGADVTALSRLLRTHPAHFSRADVVELRRRFAAKFPGQELPS
ncbi:MAG TPA: hypothetical protein HA252_05915 [Candidatus Diapherotrites archaeon]|uniref:Uncharacterized protein n=1 Tax=Candidatus Iainarchaeum sp. TaxID=3101447 RepID=A0A7J4JGM4_9ARCH|nr:hypothetical protein [Candidatus Diapherotrites archaeon]HIH16913.1 hypothetical protein [Candidatus Diapherotrites archaeon]